MNFNDQPMNEVVRAEEINFMKFSSHFHPVSPVDEICSDAPRMKVLNQSYQCAFLSGWVRTFTDSAPYIWIKA